MYHTTTNGAHGPCTTLPPTEHTAHGSRVPPVLSLRSHAPLLTYCSLAYLRAYVLTSLRPHLGDGALLPGPQPHLGPHVVPHEVVVEVVRVRLR